MTEDQSPASPRRVRPIVLRGRAPFLESAPRPRKLATDAVIDLRLLEFATPLELVGIASLVGAAPEGASVRIVPPADANVASYLHHMRLPGALAVKAIFDPPLEAPRIGGDPEALIELTHIRDGAEIDGLAVLLYERLERILSYPNSHDAFRVVSELLENAATHAASPSGVYLAAQYYTGATSRMPPGFWIAVADAGIGIRAHLAQNPTHRHLRDVEAIRVASRIGVSGTLDDSRGFGLPDVRSRVGHVAPGRLVIQSGHGEGSFFVGPAGATARYRRRSSEIQGTWVLALAGTIDGSGKH